MLTISRRRDEKGLVGVILTIVIVWALLAVIELTRTTIAAQEINHTVVVITGNVTAANSHLNTGCVSGNCPTNALPVLATTVSVANQINSEAAPLTGQLAQVKNDTASINATAMSILQNAQSINTTVVSINSLALSIGASVGSIHNSFVGINNNVTDRITPGLQTAANGQVATIVADVNVIRGDLDNIDKNEAAGILVQAKDICADQPVNPLGLGGVLSALLPIAGKNICTA
jgi:hypothetical protein